MGGAGSKLPFISKPDGYEQSKEILDDPFYGPHYMFFAKMKDGVVENPNLPPRVMGKVYQCPDGYSQLNRVSILLDQRKQMNGEHCLKLLNHENMINKGVHIACWEYPSYTLDAELKARSAESARLNFVALTQVVSSYRVLQ